MPQHLDQFDLQSGIADVQSSDQRRHRLAAQVRQNRNDVGAHPGVGRLAELRQQVRHRDRAGALQLADGENTFLRRAAQVLDIFADAVRVFQRLL